MHRTQNRPRCTGMHAHTYLMLVCPYACTQPSTQTSTPHLPWVTFLRAFTHAEARLVKGDLAARMFSLTLQETCLCATSLSSGPGPLTIQDDGTSPDTWSLWSQGWAEGTRFGELELCLLVRGKTDQSEHGILQLGCIA